MPPTYSKTFCTSVISVDARASTFYTEIVKKAEVFTPSIYTTLNPSVCFSHRVGGISTVVKQPHDIGIFLNSSNSTYKKSFEISL